MQPTIKITITSATTKLSGYNTLISRLKVVQDSVKSLPQAQQDNVFYNTLIAERNIAAFSADQYAALNQDKLFDIFCKLAEDIDELFK